MSPARRLHRRAIGYAFCSEMSFVLRAYRGLSGGDRASVDVLFVCARLRLPCKRLVSMQLHICCVSFFGRAVVSTSCVRFAATCFCWEHCAGAPCLEGCCHRSFVRCDLCLSWSHAASPPFRPRRRSDVALHNETMRRWSFLVSSRSLAFLICALHLVVAVPGCACPRPGPLLEPCEEDAVLVASCFVFRDLLHELDTSFDSRGYQIFVRMRLLRCTSCGFAVICRGLVQLHRRFYRVGDQMLLCTMRRGVGGLSLFLRDLFLF